MFNLPQLHGALVEAAVGLLILAILLVTGRWLKRKHGVQLGFTYVLFAICAAVYVPLKWLMAGRIDSSRHLMHLEAAVLILGTICGLTILRRFYWELWFERHYHARAPKFLSQVVALMAVVAALLFTLRVVYQLPIGGAVLGSTVVVGIIGFAMQDLLGNIISGMSIEIGKPYRVGDWLIVDTKRAEVMEVNWRSTRLRDNDGVSYDVPNRHMVGTTIINLTYPDRLHGVRLRVHFEYAAPPNRVKDCLQHAALNAEGVLSQPKPAVFLVDYGESAILYEIRIWIEDESRYNPICDAVRTNIWYESQRAGIRIPFPIRTVQIDRPKVDNRTALEVAHTSIRRQPFLQLLSREHLDRLLADARLLRFGRGEKIIEEGKEGRSMFILVHGSADVFVRVNDEQRHVATLKDGDYCGEMSLLTGEPRSATVKALTDCEMWEISKGVLAEILSENKTLVERLSEILAKRKMETDGVIEASLAEDEKDATVNRYKRTLLERLYHFFEL
ncbi:MAG TPA: cyclic nucleotide-binding domain-containing protein [Chthoniobacteraceae bacterium]|nr:cyclic nucleotide-binding domain-containing protein [Chthoniobacteraceae bacterium]